MTAINIAGRLRLSPRHPFSSPLSSTDLIRVIRDIRGRVCSTLPLVLWFPHRGSTIERTRTEHEGAARTRRRHLAGLGLAHILSDGYASFPAPLLTVLASSLGVPYASLGLLYGLNGVSGAVANIVGGLVSDRWKHSVTLVVLAGAALAVVCMSAIGVMPGLGLLAVVMLTGQFGCGIFHPAAFSLAGDVSHPRRHHGVSLVMAVGIAACGLGPLFVSQVVRAGGLRATPWCMLPGLVILAVAALLLRGSHRADRSRAQADAARPAGGGNGRKTFWVLLLFTNSVLRSVSHIGLIVIVSYLAEEVWGLSVAASGIGIGLLQTGSGCGILLGGAIIRTGAERRSLVACVPFCLALLVPMALSRGYLWFAWLFLFGLAVNVPNSVVVAMAQRVVPRRSALVSGLMVGPAWAVGGLLASGTTPLLIQHAGQQLTMAVLAVPLVLSMLVASLLPGREKK